jgi:peptidyl-prolyl cis-trans isomerase A (cyclophilin A)
MILQTLILTLALAAAPAASPVAVPQQSPAAVAASDTRPYVALATNAGTIVIRLEDKRAPVTTANFLRYVDSKRMDGFTFYRTTRSWGPDSRLVQAGNRGDPRKNYPPIAHEPTTLTGLTHCKGAIAMARLAPGDATTDFFLLLSDIPGFDADPKQPGDNAGFAVFGEIVAGAEVAEQIYAAPTSETAGDGPMKGQMIVAPFKIVSARRVAAPADAPKGCVVRAQ